MVNDHGQRDYTDEYQKPFHLLTFIPSNMLRVGQNTIYRVGRFAWDIFHRSVGPRWLPHVANNQEGQDAFA